MKEVRLTIDGREYIAVPADRWAKLPRKLRMRLNEDPFERFRTANGDYEAIPTLRASISQDIVRQRRALGWSRQQLAAKAHIRQATLVSLESGRKTPNVRTVEKVEAVLRSASAGGR